ncbi:MAG: sugar phosphate isomerase/epimerase family protein [Eubacteriales bacterium]
MVKYRFSAFADEYSSSFDEQIEGLIANKVRMIELRGVDGINVSDLTPIQAADVHKKLESAGIAVSAVGSPLGKIRITDSMEEHLEKVKNTCEIASILQTPKIRVFSFYIPDGAFADSRGEVMDRLGRMLDIADEYGVKMCHENERGIYGDNAERCCDLLDEFDGRLGCVFDPANFILCGVEPFPYAYNILKRHITYMHIKDALRNGTIVPAGQGVGGIPELLAMINMTHTGDFILTVEPHLRVFAGLDKLDGEHRTAVANAYPTSAEAFAAAVTNLRWCIPRNAEQG